MNLHREGPASAGQPVPEGGSAEDPSPLRKASAWGVHLLTASGAVFCLLAIAAGTQDHWRGAFAWLALAMLVDMVDGFLARWVRVKDVLPHFDGTLLDNLVDYAGYVMVPAFLLLRAELLPQRCSFWGAAAIVLASAYQFCQGDAKTPDHYFKGFPSYWNLTVFYLLALRLSPWVNLAIIGLLIVLVFVPIKYVYPSRTPRFQKLTLTLGAVWSVTVIAILWQLPDPPLWLLGASLLYVVYYFGASVYLTLERPLRAS